MNTRVMFARRRGKNDLETLSEEICNEKHL